MTPLLESVSQCLRHSLKITSIILYLVAVFCSYTLDAISSIETMTLEQKVGQLLMVSFHGDTVNEGAKTLIQEVQVGGFIYYNWANGLHTPEQVDTLSRDLQTVAKNNGIPLFIAVDQEGGIINRISNGRTLFPGNRALGETRDPNLAKLSAKAIGDELKSIGINMNFAPVVDININPRNPVIGIRSFGDNPETVTIFSKKALQGYKQANIIACLKHFPGHGDVEIDSHNDLPILHKSLDELEQTELLPFKKLAQTADMIMTAHILAPALDKDNCSTLSEKALTYLRKKIGFEGIIITDSLVMQGVLKHGHSIDEVAIQAVNAGCDIILLGGRQLIGENKSLELTVEDIQRIHSSLIAGVKSGRILEARIDDAVQKILKLKKRYLNSTATTCPNLDEHEKLAQKIASLALTSSSKKERFSDIFPLNQKKIVTICPHILLDSITKTDLQTLGKTHELLLFNNSDPTLEEIETAKKGVQVADIVLIFSYSAWKNPSQIELINCLVDIGKPVILVVTRDPLDVTLFSKPQLIVTTFSPTSISLQAALNHLKEIN